MKSLYDISWQVDENTYREDKALSYSTLSRFSKEGFHKIDTLFDQISTSSLQFGSLVDTLTLSPEEFDDKFLVVNITLDEDTATIIKSIYDNFKDQFQHFLQIPIVQVSQIAKQNGFWPADKWSDNARYNGLLKKGDVNQYYGFLRESDGKTVITSEQYQDALKCVQALKTSEATRFYFADNVPNHPVQRYYQLKFKHNFRSIDYKCMADLILVDYTNKKIYPVDLKTSSSNEDEFYKSFIKWNYFIQSKLYYRIIRECLLKDEFFKDFELEDYTFIVINKNNLMPLTWRFTDTKTYGTVYYGKNKQIICKDPFDIGDELNYYLTHPEVKVPKGINLDKTNDIVSYLNELE